MAKTLETEAERATRMAAMREELATYEAEQAEARKAAAAEAIAPAREIAESEGLADLIASAENARIKVARFSQLASLLDNIVQCGKLLPGALDRAEAEAVAALAAEAALAVVPAPDPEV